MSKTAKEYLESEVKRLVSEARGITRAAEDEDRALADDERARVEGLLSETKQIEKRLGDMKANEDLLEAIAGVESSVGSSPSVEKARPARTTGEAFVGSEAYKGLKARGLRGRWTTGPIEFGVKLTDGDGNDVQSITDAGGELPLAPQVLAPIGPVEQALTIADLFGQAQATQNSIVYLEENSSDAGVHDASPYNNTELPATAVVTAEGGVKPNANLDFVKRSVSVEKLAAFLPISDEMLEDEPQIASYINQRLPLFVRQAEEAYLMTKLLASGVSTALDSDVTGTQMFDAIAAGILKIQLVGGLSPDALVINPTDFWKMSVLKDGVNGGYFSGGPYSGPAATPWGLRTVVTSAIAAGSPLVGAFREGATVFRKGGLSVEASNSHEDYFIRNLTALRAEERLALVVLRPKAFCSVSVD